MCVNDSCNRQGFDKGAGLHRSLLVAKAGSFQVERTKENLDLGVKKLRNLRFRMFFLFTCILIILVIFGAQLQVQTVSARPSYTSSSSTSPGTNTCAGCHSGSAASGGSAVVTFPSGLTYTPGVTQHLTVQLTDPTHAVYSYLLTARLASNPSSQAGTFTAGTGSTVSGMDIESSSFSSPTWAIDWTPPSTSSGNVTFYLTGLAAGSPGGSTSGNGIYQSTFTVAAATVTPPAATISASPTSLSFKYQIGGTTPAAQTVSVASSGTALNFTTAAATTTGGSWLSATPASGSTTSGSVSVAVNPSGLAAGTYTGTIQVASSGATGSPVTTSVTLVVSSATVVTPTLSASPSTMSFAYTIGGTSPASQPILVSATPSAVSFTGAAATTSGGSWLSATPASGTTPGTVNVSVSPSSLAAGTYTGTVKVTSSGATGSPVTTSVTLVVSSATAVTPTLTASPSTMSFAYTIGGTAPASQPILVSSTPSALSFTSASTGTWLSATPASGATPGTVNASVNPSGLTAGSYTGTVTIASSGATGSPQIVHVTLVVSSATSGSTLKAAPGSLGFNFHSGGTAPPPQKLALTVSGTSASYSASTSGGPWLTVSPASGSFPGAIAVSVNPAGMSAGTFSGMIHLSAPGATTLSVPVTLDVTSATTCTSDCGTTSTTVYAEPFVLESSSTGGVAALWVRDLGMPAGASANTGDLGLLLVKNTNAPTGSQAGALVKNVQGSLTELGFDYRVGGQCTATSPRFVVVTSDAVTHVVGGCSNGTVAAAPVVGWERVRFNLADTAQTSPAITPGEQVSTITLILDEGPASGAAAAGGLVVIDNIDINGKFAEKIAGGSGFGRQPIGRFFDN